MKMNCIHLKVANQRAKKKSKTEKKIGQKAHECKVSLARFVGCLCVCVQFSFKKQAHRMNATHSRIQLLIFGHDFKVHFSIDISIKSS